MALETLSEEDHPTGGPWVDAAVVALTFRENGENFLVLNKRTEEVLHHKGQICFPGGVRDPEDTGLWETAIREVQEEMGIIPHHLKRVRELSRQYTPTGYRVTPFLAELKTGKDPKPAQEYFKPSQIEIAEVLSVPFAFFQNRENLRLRTKVFLGREFIDPLFVYNGHEIWGMTGRIVCEIFGLPTK